MVSCRGQGPCHAGVTQPPQSLSSTNLGITKSSAVTTSALSFVKRQNQDVRTGKKGSKGNSSSHGRKQGVRQGH